MMPTFDATISLGNILTIIGFFVGMWLSIARLYTMMDRKATAFETMLETHAKTLVLHAGRMEKQDDLLLKLVGDVQRLIGRLEEQKRG